MLERKQCINALFEPSSLAIVGASATEGKWGNILSRTALEGAHRRQVYFVNRGGGEILGRTAYTALTDLPKSPELVLLSVPDMAFDAALKDALDCDAKAIIAVSAGAPGGAEADRTALQLKALREAGAVMLGPNCMGVIDTHAELSAAAHLTLPPGDIALVTQSGGLGIEVGRRAKHHGIGFSRFASLGNQIDVTAIDLIDNLTRHEHTKVIALYLEDMGQGRELAEVALAARNNGKHVVLLSPGRTQATQRAALSHTGSLAGDDAAIDALCEAGGITRVRTPRELLSTACALRAPRPINGSRLAIISDGGGAAVVASGLAEEAGFTVPNFSSTLQSKIADCTHELATVGNPVDLLADDPMAIAHTVRLTCASNEVDGVIISGVFGDTASKQYPEVLGDLSDLEVEEVQAAADIGGGLKDHNLPIVGATISTPSPVINTLAGHGVTMYGDVESAVSAMQHFKHLTDAPTVDFPTIPPAKAAITNSDYAASREFFAEEGIQFAQAWFVTSLESAKAAASEIGFPVVLKAMGLLHKSDVGGVALGIHDLASLEEAYTTMQTRLNPLNYSIEQMADLSAGVELIVGTRWDERLGPLLLVGIGGIFTEILRDVRTMLAPTSPAVVESNLRKLRGAGLLDGQRGQQPVDVDAIVDLASNVSRLAAEHPEIAEMEINPVLALPHGALALDARIVLASEVTENSPESTT